MLPSTMSVLSVSQKGSVITKAKKKATKHSSKFSHDSLHVLVDANKREHLVYKVQTIHHPTVACICFVDSRGRHALVDPAALSPAHADFDLSSVDRWWEGCSLPKTRADLGTAFFPPPLEGFNQGDYVTVCIPEHDPLPALVDKVYPAAILTGRLYHLLYSEDSPYSSGTVAAFEVTGPAINFNPATDFKLESVPAVQEPLSPTDWSMPVFTPADAPADDLPAFDPNAFSTTPDDQAPLFSDGPALEESLECLETFP